MAFAQLGIPLQVDTVNNCRIPQTNLLGGAFKYGPILNNGNLYVVLSDETISTVAVFKSTDNGVTWVRKDKVHEPANSNVVAATYPDAGNTIFLCYSSGAGSNAIRLTFDMSTDSYSAPSIASGVGVANDFCLVRQSNDDYYVFYTAVVNGSTQTIRYTKFSGGVWGAAVDVTATVVGTHKFTASVVLDSSDRMHVFFTQGLDPLGTGPLKIGYVLVSATGVAGAASILYTSALAGAANESTGTGVYRASTDEVFFTFNDVLTTSLKVLSGTPSNAPVFTTTAVAVLTNPVLFNTSIYMTVNAGIAYLFYAIGDGTTNNRNLFQLSNSGAGWSAASLLYDPVASPPNANPNQVISQVSALVFSATRVGVLTVMTLVDAVTLAAFYNANANVAAAAKTCRLQIYDDGAGEYIFDSAITSALSSGSDVGAVGVPLSPFILPSPLAIVKPGLLTIQISNVNKALNVGGLLNQNNPITAFVALVFAVPKRCNTGKGKVIK